MEFLPKTFSFDENILRVVFCAGEIPEPSIMIDKGEPFIGRSKIDAIYNENGIEFEYEGEVFLKQTALSMTEKELTKYDGKNVKIRSQKTANGESWTVDEASEISDGTSFCAKVTFDISDSLIFGLGQQEDGHFIRNGRHEYLYQNNMMIPMPVIVSNKGWALFFDAGCVFTFDEKDSKMELEFSALDSLDYYVIKGESIPELIRGIRQLTGQAAMLPKWAMGYVQSKERYVDQWDIINHAKKFKELNIPLSCIVLDWQSWEDGKWGNKYVDKYRFRDLPQMVKELHDMGVAFMISVWPNMSLGCENNREFMEENLLLANASAYDAFSQRGREIYFDQLRRELYSAGTDAWWCDSTEPCTPDWSGSVKLCERERFELTRSDLEKYLGARRANLYAVYHAMGVYDGLKEHDDRRVLNLTRSGYPSIQKYGALLWSGDTAAKWSTLKNQIAEALNMSISGYPYWTLDIGAFFVKAEERWFWRGDYSGGVSDDNYKELYLRWLQFGTFLPVMRSHGTDTPREPWHFGDPGDTYYESIVDYIRLRYRLMPYSYSLMAHVHFLGDSFIRPLVFDFAHDDIAVKTDDQYMFGPAFLVCPVYEPMGKDAEEPIRRVYLPSKAKWYDERTMDLYEGGQYIDAIAPVESMPLYIKAGSIIPISAGGSGELDAIEIYPGEDAQFTLYLDGGNDYTCDDGNFCAIDISWDEKEQQIICSAPEGLYPFPEKLTFVLRSKDESFTKSVKLTSKGAKLSFKL